MNKKSNPHMGSGLDEILEQDGSLEAANSIALKRVLGHQLEKAMKEKNISKTEMSRLMQTSRSALDRLLDPENTGVTLQTMYKAAKVVGKRIQLDLVDI